jgi:Na+-transporting NADH:ubiquinone oxidoreductase subunit NqrF
MVIVVISVVITLASVVVIMIVVVVVIVIMVCRRRVVVLADAVQTQGRDGLDVEAAVGAEALRLEEVLLAVIVVATKVDLAAINKLGDRAASVAADAGDVVEVEVNVGADLEEERRDGEEGGVETHVENVYRESCLVLLL